MELEFYKQYPWLLEYPWIMALVKSAIVLTVGYFIGIFVKSVICHQLTKSAAKTTWQWDDVVIEAVRKGVPIWSILVGAYVALGFWEMSANLKNVLDKTLFVLIALSVTFILAGVVGKLVALYSGKFQQTLPATSLTQNIAKTVIIAIGLMMILNGLGISIAPILTALGVGGLAVALALQDTLANLFAGFYMTVARQIKVDDYIKLDSGDEGYVIDIGWRVTKIRMLPNNVVLVPNAKLSQSTIINYCLPNKELAVLLQVGVDYASNLEQVERVTCEVAREVMQTVAGGVPTFEPVIRYHTFGDSSINFSVVLRAKEFVDQYLIKHEFIKRLHQRYEKENISIPFPIRTVYTRSLDVPSRG